MLIESFLRMCLGLLYAKKDVPFSAGWLIFTCHGHCDYHSYKRAGFFIRNYYTPGQILPLKLTTPVNRAPDCPGPDCPGANCPPLKNGQLGPGQLGHGEQTIGSRARQESTFQEPQNSPKCLAQISG